MQKKCSKCKSVKDFSCFYKCDGLKTKHKLTSWCTECIRAKNLKNRPKIENLSGEVWKDIEGFVGYYQISNFGRLKSLARTIYCNNGMVQCLRDRLITFKCGKDGYHKTLLCKEGEKFYVSKHVIIAKAFIPNPENKPCINHIDANPRNNNIENLEWCTYSENTLHAYKLGNLSKVGELNHMNKLSKKQVIEIFNSNNNKDRLMNKYGVSIGTINDIKSGRRWDWLTKKKAVKMYSHLPDEKVIEILSKPNIHYKTMADMFNVSFWTILEIRSGKSHKKLFNQYKTT